MCVCVCVCVYQNYSHICIYANEGLRSMYYIVMRASAASELDIFGIFICQKWIYCPFFIFYFCFIIYPASKGQWPIVVPLHILIFSIIWVTWVDSCKNAIIMYVFCITFVMVFNEMWKINLNLNLIYIHKQSYRHTIKCVYMCVYPNYSHNIQIYKYANEDHWSMYLIVLCERAQRTS